MEQGVSLKSPSPAPANLLDFTDRWSPMLVKELRQGLRARWFVVPFLLLHLCVLGAVAMEYLILRDTAARGGGTGLADWAGSKPGLFWVTVYIVVAGIMPMRCMESLREESTQGNAEMLLLGGLSRWQIVRGKWLVQGVLTLLSLLSLMPYMLVRYFFGGVELWQNFFTLLSVCAASLGVSGCVLGASGYAGLGMRFSIVIYSGFLLMMTCVYTESMIASAAGKARVVDLLGFAYLFSYAVLLHLLYGIMGLQLGRAHLKLYLLPFELSPTRSVTTLMFTMPFILIAGTFATCIGGSILVLILMVYVAAVYDRPVKTASWQSPPLIGHPRF